MESISDIDYKFLCELSEEWMGSVFGEDKKYLFENRLLTMAKEFGHLSLRSDQRTPRKKEQRIPEDEIFFRRPHHHP